MKAKKPYICVGFSFGRNNEHLLGTVGNVHFLMDWLKIAFPGKDVESYFDGYEDREIVEYLHENMQIRLEPFKR